MRTTTSFSSLLQKPAIMIVLISAGLALAFGICYSITVIPFVMGLACFVLLVGLSRLKLTSLLFSFILADHLCQFLKRSIFLLGSQPVWVYYGFQLLPSMVLFFAVGTSLYSLRKFSFPLSSKLLGLYLVIALAQTFFSPRGSTFVDRCAGAAQTIVPLFAAFAAMAVPPTQWRRIARLFLILIVISSTYGIFQVAYGPSPIDRAWAIQTGGYSIQGGKVLDYITGASSEFRAYSYYEDPTTWGFFLVLGFYFIVTSRQTGSIPRFWVRTAALFTLAGMVAAETRSPWITFLGSLMMSRILQLRSLRRPIVVITGVLIAFALVLTVGDYAFTHWAPALTNNKLINRYMTVGTIKDRLSAPTLFLSGIRSHWLLGNGYGTSGPAFQQSGQSSEELLAQDSHNVVVDLLVTVGLPGLITFIAFFYSWLSEAFKGLSRGGEIDKTERWIVSACVGMVFAGALNGGAFLTSYMAIFWGIGMGQTMRRKQEAYDGWKLFDDLNHCAALAAARLASPTNTEVRTIE